jgi:hypothetical protein
MKKIPRKISYYLLAFSFTCLCVRGWDSTIQNTMSSILIYLVVKTSCQNNLVLHKKKCAKMKVLNFSFKLMPQIFNDQILVNFN